MRKDVKRSLVFWPLLTSLIVVLVSWVGTIPSLSELTASVKKAVSPGTSANNGAVSDAVPNSPAMPTAKPVSRVVAASSPRDVKVLHTVISPPDVKVDVVERAEHGTRGMRLPLRLERELIPPTVSIATSELPTELPDEELANTPSPASTPPQNEQVSEAMSVAAASQYDSFAFEAVADDAAVEGNLALGATNTVIVDRDKTADVASDTGEHVRAVATRLTAPIREEQQELAGHDAAVATMMDEDDSSLAHSYDQLATLSPDVDYSRVRGNEVVLNVASPPASPTPEPVADPLSRESVLPKSISVLAKISPRAAIDPHAPEVSAKTDKADATESSQKPTSVFQADRRSHQLSPAGWPVTTSLDQQLELLAEYANSDSQSSHGEMTFRQQELKTVAQWTLAVQETLRELRTLPRLGDQRAGDLIDALDRLQTEGRENAESMATREIQIRFLYACFAIQRRVAVWQPIWELTQRGDTQILASRSILETDVDASEFVANVRQILDETGDAGGWARFLLLDAIENAAAGSSNEDRSMLAKRFLARLRWHGLHPEHREWLGNDAVEQLAVAVRPWTRGAVDYASLLNQIEHQEANEIDTVSLEIAEAVQTLRHADNPVAVEVADAIDTHYRNANVRLAISQSMLQRMLPTIAPQTIPVRTQMLGSRVRGTSHVQSKLSIALLPSPNHWQIDLQTTGNVRTQSVGFNGPVALRTHGDANFLATTPIEITPDGVQLGNSWVDVRGENRLHGIDTDYDNWPLIGALVRSIAESRYESLEPVSNRLAQEKVREQVGGEIDQRVDSEINESARNLSKMVLGPLGALRLDPQVADMQTTNDRLLARYRLAGDWQLGAHTPRPRALRDSLMSVQVHQSTMNNTLEQLVPRDRPRLISEMIHEGMVLFGKETATIPEDIPDDVMIQFAKTRPITVEVEDGKLWLTLRIVRLTRGETFDLRRFIVRAAYVPQVNGLHATLVRDGHLSISGPSLSMRERLPIRAIFNKVLSPNHGLPLTTEALARHPAVDGLQISQLELREGWIALSISEGDAARIATRPR
ncbi:signal peptide protein [Rhodopirellula maiorica SM1]|uniref:Signal peptide protein n=1 Tax=Rhodopirellula maiorica SM1 TaxID=1265738 RepID=M5RGS4_9BACT|nr:signal peptide protein [Rhodopirellula maiorica SM1]